jgi:hypothetical protein
VTAARIQLLAATLCLTSAAVAAAETPSTATATATAAAPTTSAVVTEAPQLLAVGPYDVAIQTMRDLQAYLATPHRDTDARAAIMARLVDAVSPRAFRDSLNQLAGIVKKMPKFLASRYGNLNADEFRTEHPDRYEKARVKVAQNSIFAWLTLVGYYTGHIEPVNTPDPVSPLSHTSKTTVVTFRSAMPDGRTQPILFRVHCVCDAGIWYVEKIILQPESTATPKE